MNDESDTVARPTEAGVGLLPSRVVPDPDMEYGHMWIFWDVADPEPLPYRGFWPDLTEVPPEIDINDKEALTTFIRQFSVTGLLFIDESAYDVHRGKRKAACYDAFWTLSAEEQRRLHTRFYVKHFIPTGEKKIRRGRYSWNRSRRDWDNCSSWAIKLVSRVVGDCAFLRCRKPKDLSVVTRDIWGDSAPPVTKALR